MSSKSLVIVFLFFSVGWALVIYSPSLSGPLLFDDLPNFGKRSGWQLLPSLSDWLAPHRRPLVTVSFAFSDIVFGSTPAVRRFGNVLIHGLVATGILCLGLSVGRHFKGIGVLAPLIIALLWLVHPLNSQAVAYIIQRSESLMALWFVGYLTYLINIDGEAGWKDGAFLGLFLAMGLMSKTVMIAVFVVAPLLERSVMFDSWSLLWRSRKRVYGPQLILVAWGVLTILPVLWTARAGVGFGGDAPPVEWYLLSQTRSLATYLGLSLWPIRLSIDRGPSFDRSINDVWPFLAGVLFWLGGAGCVWWKGIRNDSRPIRLVGFLMLAPILVLAPSSSFVPTADPIFEHRMYLPVLFVIALLVIGLLNVVDWGLRNFARESRSESISIAAKFLPFGFLFLCLSYRTYHRAADYASIVKMWSGAVSVDANNDRAVVNLVEALGQEGLGHKTEQVLERLAIVADSRGQPIDVLITHLSMIWVRKGEIDRAINALQEVTRRLPETDELVTYRGRRDASTPYVHLSIAYQQAGMDRRALEAIENAIRYDDTAPYSYAIAGHIWKRMGNASRAKEAWTKAISLRTEPWPEMEADLQLLDR